MATTEIDATIVKRLKDYSRKRKQAEESATRYRDQTDALIVEGHEAGVSKAALAEAAGLTRQTIYTVLLKAGRG